MYQIRHENIIMATGETRADCIEQLAPDTIIEINNGKVTVCNNVWIKKRIELSNSYSNEYNRREILHDIAEKVCRMNGYNLERIGQ